MTPLCIIPARGGSKRLARKNVLPLLGKPMLLYTIEAALESAVFKDIYVSTDDDEIARIAEEGGAVAHFRPSELAGDLVSATDVCLEVCKSLAARRLQFDAIVCLQPTSPLRSATDITASWEQFASSDADYLVSATPIDPHYFHWAVIEDEAGWRMYFGEQYLQERPLLPPVFRPNGAIKIGRSEKLAVSRNFFGRPLAVHHMPEERSVHVACQFDLELAESLLGKQRGGEVQRPT